MASLHTAIHIFDALPPLIASPCLAILSRPNKLWSIAINYQPPTLGSFGTILLSHRDLFPPSHISISLQSFPQSHVAHVGWNDPSSQPTGPHYLPAAAFISSLTAAQNRPKIILAVFHSPAWLVTMSAALRIPSHLLPP